MDIAPGETFPDSKQGAITSTTADGANGSLTFETVEYDVEINHKSETIGIFDLDGNSGQISFGSGTGTGRSVGGGSFTTDESGRSFRMEYTLSGGGVNSPVRMFHYTADARL